MSDNEYLNAARIQTLQRLSDEIVKNDKMTEDAIETYFERQIEWSYKTFGPSLRTKGIVQHIRKELLEIEAEPHDLSEWIDVVILAMDGFWRHGGRVDDLMPRLLAKQRKNMARKWPSWWLLSEDTAIEHDRSEEVPTDHATALAAIPRCVKCGKWMSEHWDYPDRCEGFEL